MENIGYIGKFVAAVRRKKTNRSLDSRNVSGPDVDEVRSSFGVCNTEADQPGTNGTPKTPATILALSVLDHLNIPSPPASGVNPFGSFSGSDTTEISETDSTDSQDTRLPVFSLVEELTTAVMVKRPPPHQLYSFLAEYLEDKLEQRTNSERHRRSAKLCSKEAKEKQRKLARLSPDFSQVRKGTLVGSQEFASLRDDVQVSAYTVYSEARNWVQMNTTYSTPAGDPCRATLLGHKKPITQVLILAGHVITSSMDSTIRIWDVKTGNPEYTIKCHKPVNAFVFLRVENRKYILLAGCNMGEVEMFSVKFGHSVHVKFITKRDFHVPNPVTTLTVSPDRLHLASGSCYPMYTIENRVLKTSARGNLKTWKVQDIVAVSQPDGSEAAIIPCMTCTARQIVAKAVGTGVRTCCDSVHFDASSRMQDYGVTSLKFTPDSSMLVVGFGCPMDSIDQGNKMVVICCVESMRPVYMHQQMSYPIVSVATCTMNPMRVSYAESDDVTCGLFVQTSRNVGRMKLGKKQRGEPFSRLDVEWQTKAESVQHGMAMSADRMIIAAAHSPFCTGHRDSKTVQLTFHELSTGDVVMTYDTGHTRPVTHVSYSVDGTALCTASLDGTAKIWNSPIPHFDGDSNKKSGSLDDGDMFDAQGEMKKGDMGLAAAKHLGSDKFKAAGRKVKEYGNLWKVFSEIQNSTDTAEKEQHVQEILVRPSMLPDIAATPHRRTKQNDYVKLDIGDKLTPVSSSRHKIP